MTLVQLRYNIECTCCVCLWCSIHKFINSSWSLINRKISPLQIDAGTLVIEILHPPWMGLFLTNATWRLVTRSTFHVQTIKMRLVNDCWCVISRLHHRGELHIHLHTTSIELDTNITWNKKATFRSCCLSLLVGVLYGAKIVYIDVHIDFLRYGLVRFVYV